ncbi:MAG: fibronectin type III domain-containing protein, partial [Cytophagales bacterium]|nr:fibronectin type III domain-containing protein [Cytophagales bacterium]
YAVRLAFVLEGAGIRIETNPNFAPPPIVLEGGVPQVLGSDELGIYLDPRNLLFNGITRQQYEQRAALPEGFYRFSFRVLDYRRKDVQLSREATANAWFVLNDPPRLNTPVCGTTLPLRDPQNIFFQWLPMGAASPNSALTTEYEFTLVEVRPPGRNPNDAINVGVPLFQFTTQQTSLVYGILEPALIAGQEYAFRVRAKDTNGKDLFKNQGYSEVCTFKFGEVQAVPPPEGLNIYPESERRAKVTWYQMLEADRYRVEYRKKPATPEEANRAWFTKETLEDNTVLNDLEAETEYELRVANVVKNIISRYTEIKTFRTLPVRVFACGQQVDNITPANQKPLLSPFIGQLWKIGKFDMEVMQVRGSNGTYSGLGAVIIPYLGFRVYGTFQDIKVNENREVIVGTVVGLSEGVEAFKKRFEKEVPQVQEGDPTATAIGANGILTIEVVDEKRDKDLDSVYVDSKGTIVVVDSEGGQEKIAPTKGKGTRITDKNGDQWIVNPDGKVSKVPSTAISNAPPAVALTSPSQANYAIEFLANSKQRNGFDQKEDTYNLPDYETIKVNGKDYTVAWKSVESGQQDWVNAKATGQATFPKAVGFKTIAGEAASQAGSDASQKQVAIMGKADGQEEELTAYVKVKEPSAKDEQVLELGKLNIKSYSKVRKKVIVVPVNDAEAPSGLALAAELNSIYKQAVSEWDVTVAESFTIAAENLQGLDDGQSGMLSSFPPKMREFRRAFKNDRSIDGSAYYVFLVKGSGSQRAGFMPFKREFGFVFTDRASNVTTTIAHELGHGAFRLRHTFSSEDFKATERTTTNLMDYNGGTVLKKYQWDFVHDPESMNGWLQGDEESALMDTDCNPSLVPESLRSIADRAKQCDNDVDDDLERISEADLAKLCVAQRIDLIKCVDDFPAQGGDDEILIKLLTTTPSNYRAKLMARLQDERIYENRLIEAVDGEEFIELVNTISQWMGTPTQADWENAVIANRFLFFDGDDAFLADFDGTSMIFKTRKNFTIGWYQEVTVKPHEFVAVTFTNDFIIAGKEFKAGNQVTMSGLAVWSLFNEMFNKRLRAGGAVALDIPLLFVGVGEVTVLKNVVGITRAIRALRYARATANIVIAAGGLVMASGIEDELTLTEDGRETLRYWTWFNLIYAGGTLTPHAINSAKGLYSSCKNLLTRPGLSESVKNSLKAWMETLKDIFKKNGQNIDELDELGSIYNRLGELKPPARTLLENEDILIDASKGLQSSKAQKFTTVIAGEHGDVSTKYLWTIDERGINIALEKTPFPTPRGNIVHTNLSSKAYIGGEMWFSSGNKIIVNAGSGRFGDGAGATLTQWEAAIDFWKKLGYEVEAIPLGTR